LERVPNVPFGQNDPKFGIEKYDMKQDSSPRLHLKSLSTYLNLKSQSLVSEKIDPWDKKSLTSPNKKTPKIAGQ